MLNYRLTTFLEFAACWTLITFFTIGTAIPLGYENATNLLPAEPQDVNETLAAVVIDPVVKDAVRKVAGNGSLNGLVVNRKVLVMPVTDPQMIISEREQVFVVPTEHLEDVRKNITDSEEESQLHEFASAEKNPLFGGTVYINGTDGNAIKYTSSELKFDGETENDSQRQQSTENNIDSETGTSNIPEIPEEISEVTVPIVAVIDPSNVNNGKVKTPIMAILPNQVDGQVLRTQVDFLNNNQEEIQSEAQTQINKISLAVDPENWRLTSTPSEVRPTSVDEEYSSGVPLQSEHSKLFITTFVAPNLGYAPRFLSAEVETKEREDMDVAEDIVFRPLFRYRQEAAQRARNQEEENSYRRSSYRRRRPYDSYDSYPVRNYNYRQKYNYDYYN